jgi:nitrogen-specific signal transduction histidine kinase/CheY-like chemotaxis protein
VAEEERKKIESRLNQSEKMEAIGNLAGGIAHDFNNILGVIMGYCSILRNRMAEGDPGISYVNNIMSASEKAVDLVKSLLAFGRKQNIEIKHCRINEIVRGVEKLLVRLLPEDINLSVELDESEPVIMADISQIDRVFLNLATNSRDAMPAGGSFVIRTGTVLLDREFMDTWGYGEPGRYVLVSVSDTGKGFDEVTGKKIFDPFFTTKEEGKGTGMGLSNVYGIIRQHKGFINVYSEPDRGTVFRIYLPAVEEGEAEGEAERTADSLRGGTETILVGEDYDDLREIMKTLLESAGFTVIEAVDGNDAVRKFMENRDSINLLVLDVVMPGKNGRDAYDEISRIRPGIRVLFSSGYTGDVVISRGVRTESIDFVSKPLSPNELLIKVREMLDK